METITPAEAIKALADSKSIISDWDERPAKIIGDLVAYPDGSMATLSNLLNGKNLRIYEEPKKQIKVALYAYFNEEKWTVMNGFFKDDEDFLNRVVATIFKRLDGTNGTQDTTMLVDDY